MGCGEKEKTQTDLAAGNWTQLKNRAYILLVTSPAGGWNSSVRITDATSKIVQSKGSAKGTWHIDKNQMIFTVMESDLEQIWEPNATLFYDIVELTETQLHLKDESGYISIWKKTNSQQAAKVEAAAKQTISMKPIAVNLNKNRSNDKDRYFCLDLTLVLKELMPDQEIPAIHPRAREAAVLYLSSLVFNDVKDFDRVKERKKEILAVMNPYMDGAIEEIKIEHVIVASAIEKVEEFLIEHTLVEEAAPPEGEEGEETAETEKES